MSDDDITATIVDRGVEISAPDRADDFLAAGTAATLMAENLDGRYEDTDLAAMLRTAARLANDVHKFRNEADPTVTGQFVDVLLLGMAASWWARTLERPHNKGPDPEEYHDAAETMADVWDTLFRQQGIQAIAGRLGITEHRYRR